MKHPSQFIALFAALSSSLVTAETISLKGTSEGSIDKVQVETATETKVLHWSADANFDSPHETFTFPGEWTFSWDSNQPASVEFTGSFNFGTHYTITDAGSLGGVTRQVHTDFTHHVGGTAAWDPAASTVTFRIEPGERDAGGASTVTMAKPSRCEKVKGMMAGTACKAFENSSPELEGLDLELTFSADRSDFTGTATLIQFGGSGLAKSRSEIRTTIRGEARQGR